MKILGALFAAVALIIVVGGGGIYMQMTGALTSLDGEISPGDAMPDFTMTDDAGEVHTLSDYRGRIVVLDFCSHKCPWSVGADARLNELAEAYAEHEVVFLGIDSHHETPVSELREYRAGGGKAYPILKDEGHAYADRIGARVTPEIFVIDSEGVLVYNGAADNSFRPDSTGSVSYVEQALEQLLAGEPVRPSKTAGWGCTIKRAS
jgi:peroxiredoxin